MVESIKKISHVADEVLKFANAQMLDEEVGFAREEQLVVCSNG